MARVEEARRAALRRLPSGKLRLRRAHRPAALLERRGHARDVLRPARTVERLLGLGVALHGLAVVLLSLRVRVGHLDVEVERPDVVTQRHEVLARHLLHLVELGLRGLLRAPSLPPAAQRE
jgi:hypothetical protein